MVNPARHPERPNGRSRNDLAGTSVAGELWSAIPPRRARVLMLDYDGTLAPYTLDRRESRMPDRTREAIAAIARLPRDVLAIVSGRPLRELERLFAPLDLTLVGEHGWDERSPARRVEHPLPIATSRALERAAEATAPLAGERLEIKRTSLALHVRGLPEGDAARLVAACESAWRPATEAAPLAIRPMTAGLELRATGRDKGTAVRGLVARAGAGAFGVFVGDDVTDEDAFAALEGSGAGIRVGDPEAPTRAGAHLPSSEAVADFLEEWLRRASERAAPEPGPPEDSA